MNSVARPPRIRVGCAERIPYNVHTDSSSHFKGTSMKFWLTVVVSVIAISSIVTWLSMKGGAQAEEFTKKPAAQETPPEKKPAKVASDPDAAKVECISGGKIEWSTIPFEAGDSPRDKERYVDVQFRN